MAWGGVRPGAGKKKQQSTIQAEKLRAYLIEEILKEKGPLVQALINQAKRGNVVALREIFERSIGKVVEEHRFVEEITIKIDV